MSKDDRVYLSREKLEELRKELEYLMATKRREVASSLEQAKSLGDLRENSEYQEARRAQAALEERLAYLTTAVRKAVVIDSHHSTKVEIGSTVVIQKEGGNSQKIQVVGSSEADVEANRISNKSPVGLAMMGKVKGDSFSVQTARGSARYKIIDIE